jgi:transposase
MGAAYSYDLRVKVMKFLEEKNTIKAASKIFGISRKTIIEWKKIKKATGDVKAKEGYQVGHRQIIKDVAGFKELVEANRDKSTAELAKMWPQKVSRWAVAKLLKKLGYTYKKNLYSPQEK